MDILQLSWFVDYVPSWLGPVLILTGFLILGFSFIISGLFNEDTEINNPILFGIAMFGGMVLIIPFYFNNNFLFATVALFAGRWVEGIAATNTITRVGVALGKLGSSSESDSSPVRSVIRRYVWRLSALTLAAMIAVWSVLFAVTLGLINRPPLYTLTLTWTLVVASVSLVGILIKFSRAPYEVYSEYIYSIPMIFGLILVVVGAQVYNFDLMQIETEVRQIEVGFSLSDPIVALFGTFIYIIAFVFSTLYRVGKIKS